MFNEQADYEICVQGHLDERRALYFEGLTITAEFDQKGTPITTLSGPIADQAALHGVLAKLRDIGIPVISVNRIKSHDEGRL